MQLGPWIFVAWQGEVFVEYALEVKKASKDLYVISLANGELQGYIVTEEAAQKNYYESGNSIFDYRGGQRILEATAHLVAHLRDPHPSAPRDLF